ncbi:MAG: choice-of-anchor L domain-containing protein [Chitinophagales bacterium]
MKKIFILATSLISLSFLQAQLQVADTLNNVDLVQSLSGPGLTISNVIVDCPDGAYGQFFGDNTNLGLDEGVLLTTGGINNAIGPNNTGSSAVLNGEPGDADLDALITVATEDACVIEFDLETIGDSLRFNYIFGSEEYLEFVNAGFNDVFAFFISGPGIVGTQNIALVPGTNIPVAIDNVNSTSNSTYYVNNGTGANAPFNTDPQYIQYDGYTVPLQAIVSDLIPCSVYHLKLAIADGGDDNYDSGVFLQAGSFTSDAVAIAAGSVVDPNYNFEC